MPIDSKRPTRLKNKPKIFISVPDDRHLDAERIALKKAILKGISDSGLDIIGFEQHQFGKSSHLDSWTVERANELIHRSDGVVVLALARLTVQVIDPKSGPSLPITQPTPYNHLEGALAISAGVPLLILKEENMDQRGIFDAGVAPAIIPSNANISWASSDIFKSYLIAWQERVHERADVFFGYCGKASDTATEIRKYLEKNGFKIVDWSLDFKRGGATVWEEIERASQRCKAAIFLFTKDDDLKENATQKLSFDAMPRDNVLVEAGFFTRSHGKSRVAIIREKGAKMPSDFGGIIYLGFDDRNKLRKTKDDLLLFLKEALK